MRALHAVFDAALLGLNGLGLGLEGPAPAVGADAGAPAAGVAAGAAAGVAAGAAAGGVSGSWALASHEDVQLACYEGGGFYRKHSDAQHLSRRVLAAILLLTAYCLLLTAHCLGSYCFLLSACCVLLTAHY